MTAGIGIMVEARGAEDEVLRFAAEELAAYAERITGQPAGHGQQGRPGIVLRVDQALPAGDAYLLRSTAEGELLIAAAAPRGVLHGVYAYLERAGCRFPLPGAANEVAPRRATLPLDGYDTLSVPSFARRGMTFQGGAGEALGWIDFCAKQRLNWLFLHTSGEEWWVEHRAALWPQMRRRGLTLELGGHLLPHLLPRSLFAAHPEWFRVAHGGRVNDHNLCPSSDEALEYLRARARRYAEETPEPAVYNIWADDVAEGASTWCACDRCHALTPADQNLLVMNALAAGLRAARPEARVVHIAYHETLPPPRAVTPAPGVVLMYAPRERCYAHALDDPSCARNRRYAGGLQALLDVFDPAEAEVLEYHCDQILFGDMAPALPDTVAADVSYYHRLGLGLLEPLLVRFSQPDMPAPLSALLHARALSDVATDTHAVLADHAATYFGDPRMAAYLEHREAALRRALTVCDFTTPTGAFWTPPLDRPAITAAYLETVEPALEDLYTARAVLGQAGRAADPTLLDRFTAEERVLALTGRRVNGQVHAARAALALHHFQSGGDAAEGRAALCLFEHAYADLNDIATLPGVPFPLRTYMAVDVPVGALRRALGLDSPPPLARDLLPLLPAALIPARAPLVAGTYNLRLDGEGGGAWSISVAADGQCLVSEGAATAPTAVLQMPAAGFVALLTGAMSPLELVFLTPPRWSGDAARMLMLIFAFRLAPA